MTWMESLPFFVTPVGAIFIALYLLWFTDRESRIAERERARAKTPAE